MDDNLFLPDYYVAVSKDQNVVKSSSSGGLFTVIANYVLERQGVVLGASFNKDKYIVNHAMAESVIEIQPMKKSKYVWSDYLNCVEYIEKAIADGRSILFTGTPCQVEVIKKKFGTYEKIVFADLFCHGTADPEYFTEYLKLTRLGVIGIDFRHDGSREDNSGDSNNFNFCINYRLSNGEIASKTEDWNKNFFTRLYVKSYVLRKACFNCPFSCKKHVSDFTLGDYEYKKTASQMVLRNHSSIISVNTDKGKEIWSSLLDQIYFEKITDKEKISFYYRKHNMKGPWGYNLDEKRTFDADVEEMGFLFASAKALYPNYWDVISRIRKMNLSRGIILYGAGNVGKDFLKVANLCNVKVSCFCVSDYPEHEYVEGIPVFRIDELDSEIINGATIVLTVSSIYQKEVVARLELLNKKSGILKV